VRTEVDGLKCEGSLMWFRDCLFDSKVPEVELKHASKRCLA
jgi:hypothetical protein